MVYSLKPHIRAASCNEDVVLLDLRSDRFHVLPDVSAERVNSALAGSDVPLAEALYEAGFVQHSTQPLFIAPRQTKGFFEQRWMTPLVEANDSWRDKLLATTEVFRTNRKLKNCTIESIMFEVRRLSAKKSRSVAQNDDDRLLGRLMACLNFGFGFDRTGNKCLAYSYTLARMARQMGIPAKLVIGVKTKPFLSHAWVEHQDKVVNDDPQLRQKLSVIVEA